MKTLTLIMVCLTASLAWGDTQAPAKLEAPTPLGGALAFEERVPYPSGADMRNDVNLVVRSVLFLYLLIGAVLEERKLVGVYRENYRRYQREVPMLLPWKILARIRGRLPDRR